MKPDLDWTKLDGGQPYLVCLAGQHRTLLPSEIVLAGWEEVGGLVKVPMGPDVIQLRPSAGGYRLERVISSNPGLYLHLWLVPGREIRLPLWA